MEGRPACDELSNPDRAACFSEGPNLHGQAETADNPLGSGGGIDGIRDLRGPGLADPATAVTGFRSFRSPIPCAGIRARLMCLALRVPRENVFPN